MKGFIISIEGGEGSGKGTVINKLKDMFPDFVFTREPGGTKISEQIRNVIVDKENVGMTPITEAMLFAAARNQHLVDKVIPALEQGKVVVFDRYYDSSLVYQGIARGLGMETVWDINKVAVGNCIPKLTIYLDIAPEKGLGRIVANNRETNRLDLESMEFHTKIRNGYLEIAKMFPERIKVVDADQSPDEVFNSIVRLIDDVM
jgi:dTMP kinase